MLIIYLGLLCLNFVLAIAVDFSADVTSIQLFRSFLLHFLSNEDVQYTDQVRQNRQRLPWMGRKSSYGVQKRPPAHEGLAATLTSPTSYQFYVRSNTSDRTARRCSRAT